MFVCYNCLNIIESNNTVYMAFDKHFCSNHCRRIFNNNKNYIDEINNNYLKEKKYSKENNNKTITRFSSFDSNLYISNLYIQE